jgi:hypothetical protein
MFYIRNTIFCFLIYKITFFLNCYWLKILRPYCGLHVVPEFKLIAQSIFHTPINNCEMRTGRVTSKALRAISNYKEKNI